MVDDNSDPTGEELMHFASFPNCDPLRHEEATQNDCWIKVIDEEIHTTQKNNILELSNLSNSKKSLSIKWVYKIKYNSNGEVGCFRTRLVTKNYKQKPSIDYFEVLYLIVAKVHSFI